MVTKVNNTVLDLVSPSVDGLDMGGNTITNHGTPTGPNDVANKSYVDFVGGGGGAFLPLAGGTMSGDIDMDSNSIIALPVPVNPSDAATKDYVDTEVASVVTSIGEIVQIVHTPFSGAILSPFNPQYPGDDTKPQQTLDTGFLLTAFNTTITPTSATNRLKIEFVLNWSITGLNTSVFFAVFQDATEDALVVTQDNDYPAANFSNATTLTFYMLAGTTSPTTFKIGYGQAGSAGTVTINGIGGTRRFGGALISHMTITEINA